MPASLLDALVLVLVLLVCTMSSTSGTLRFASSSTAPFIKIVHSSTSFSKHKHDIDEHSTASRSTITFTNTAPLTIRTSEPFARGQKNVRTFTAYMLKKDEKTAIGLSYSDDATQYEKYMTPDYCNEDRYASFGGAGFVYPWKVRAQRGYGEGDTVGVRVDFSTNTISFTVNGELAKEVQFGPEVDRLYPSISCEKGVVVMETGLD